MMVNKPDCLSSSSPKEACLSSKIPGYHVRGCFSGPRQILGLTPGIHEGLLITDISPAFPSHDPPGAAHRCSDIVKRKTRQSYSSNPERGKILGEADQAANTSHRASIWLTTLLWLLPSH